MSEGSSGRSLRPGSARAGFGARPGTGTGARPGTASHRAAGLPTFKAPKAAGAGEKSVTALSAAADADREAVEMGYNKVSRGGLQAMRVPIESFAGIFESSSGGLGVAPLQLIVDAVATTGNYAVFNSQLIRIILEFKWYGFAQRMFYMEVAYYCTHAIIVQAYNLRASAIIDYSLADVLGLPEGKHQGQPDIFTLVGFVWTTLIVVNTLLTEIRQMRHGLASYISDIWNWFDWVYILGQSAVNALFVLRDYVPELLIVRDVVNGTIISRRLGEGAADGMVDLGMGMGGVGGQGPGSSGGYDVHELVYGRTLKSKGSVGGGEDVYGETFSTVGPFVNLQSIVVVTSTLRLLYFFSGHLRLGALVHALKRIVLDILPLMTLVVVFIVAFTGAMMILVMHELQGEAYPQWHAFHDAMQLIINAGLYTATPEVAMRYGRPPLIVIMYMVFMFLVQIILLNMLIAIMAESHSRVSAQSELVAQMGRAKLILEYEQAELSRYKSRVPARHGAGGLFSHLSEHEAQRLERVCPRWLHVLMPAEHTRGEEEDLPEELKELRQLKRQLLKAEETLAARQAKMLEGIQKRDEVGERQKMLQAVRVELSQFKEEVLAGVRARGGA